jgi:hypothetical protein
MIIKRRGAGEAELYNRIAKNAGGGLCTQDSLD